MTTAGQRRQWNGALMWIAAAATACAAWSCGGGGSPSGPSPTSTPSPTPSPSATNTITITASGANPRNITVRQGTRVLFVNSDTQVHEMDSDPHPEHTDCTELNSVGFLSPGQSRETGNLVTIRTCGFHDHR